MKKIFFYLTLLIGLAGQRLSAQNVNQLYENTPDGPRYITERPQDTDTTTVDSKTVPIGLKMWTIDSRFGNTTPIAVDTLMHHFQNQQFTDGLNGEYNYLGNVGSPRISRIFFHQKEASPFIFTDPYSYFIVPVDKFHFLNTKSPFANLTYFSAGNQQNGEDVFKAYFGVNANRKLNLGFSVDYIYGRGMYNNQAISLFNGTFFSSYTGDKYDLHFLFGKNNMKMSENGGITDDTYITNPEDLPNSYQPSDIPTNLEKNWNRNENFSIFLNHRFNLGFYEEPKDTAQKYDDFVPVTSFIHTLQYENAKREYIAYSTPANYYVNDFFGDEYQRDRTTYSSLKNTFAIALREGFNKWAQAGLTAFISHEMRHYSLVDTLTSASNYFDTKYNEQIVRVGGELLREQGKTLHYRVLGETALSGEEAGTFNLTGKIDLNFRLFKDTIQLAAQAFTRRINPSFYYRHYHSRHLWWDNNLSKELRTRIEGEFAAKKADIRLNVGVENLTNYTYLDNAAQAYTDASSNTTTYLHNVKVGQSDKNIQVLSATLKKDFAFGIFHLDNEATYQKSSDQDILPLPTLSLYHNLYLKFKMAKKVLSVELGADVRYFTKYYAPDYAPEIGQFYLQNPQNRIEIGNYPIINAYANMHLKHTRIYVMMYHVSQGMGKSNYFLAPHYPLNPMWFKFGLSWNFFN